MSAAGPKTELSHIDAVKTAIKKKHNCCSGPSSITLLSCWGSSNGTAKAIADATGLPVVAANCEVWAKYPDRKMDKYAPSKMFPYKRRPGQTDDDFSKEISGFSMYKSEDKNLTWSVTNPQETGGKK